MLKILLNFTAITLLLFSGSTLALDAQGNNDWISLGVPNYIHMGTDGRFYLNGSNEGACTGVNPTYFRMDMSKQYFKEFYSWLLTMSAQNRPMDCIVDDGCGSKQVWISYCRGRLQ